MIIIIMITIFYVDEFNNDGDFRQINNEPTVANHKSNIKIVIGEGMTCAMSL